MKFFSIFSGILFFCTAAIADVLSDDQIRQLIIKQSLDKYRGACPCPYSAMKNGQPCGGRVAYFKRSGETPFCYTTDISSAQVAQWRISRGEAIAIQKTPASPVAIDQVLPQGSFSSIYRRQEWKHWVDTDRDCQDTRTEVLINESQQPVKFDSRGCQVRKGLWLDPYSGAIFRNPAKLDIDHLVPLKWAQGHGGDRWPANKKQQFANDMQNLRAVDASLNRQKNDKGPEDWLPPRHAYRCIYLADFVRVVDKYELGWTPAEKRTVERMRLACEQK